MQSIQNTATWIILGMKSTGNPITEVTSSFGFPLWNWDRRKLDIHVILHHTCMPTHLLPSLIEFYNFFQLLPPYTKRYSTPITTFSVYFRTNTFLNSSSHRPLESCPLALTSWLEKRSCETNGIAFPPQEVWKIFNKQSLSKHIWGRKTQTLNRPIFSSDKN